MSDLTTNNKSNTAASTFDSSSGKALSRARREAMSRGGKSALGQIKAVSSVNAATSPRPAISNVRKPAETISMPSVKEEIVSTTDLVCGCTGTDSKAETERENAIDDICSIVADEPGVVVGQVASAVRKLCQERRRALSSQGKNAVKALSLKASAGAGLTGRAAARARREDLCANGRGNDAACRPSGRVRPETTANKVEFGTTLSGTTVSGSQLERNSKITGVESGTCRAITGTEYIGVEQYGALCPSTPSPSPSPAKVRAGMTGKGQRVSGVDTGRGDKVTGTELAANKAVTGNEYLSTDKLELKAASRPAPDKVGMSATRSGINVSGTVVGRNVKVTGDEHGSCLAISGTEYTGSDQFESFCDAAQQAASRALIISRGAHAGTGSSIDTGNKVTGAERGESITLSGTPYSTTSQRVSQRGANNNPHPLARGPANAPREAVPAKQPSIAQGSFSIVTPARTGQASNANKISGTAYGATGRITGPVNLAAGLISGTPEFRHHDSSAPMMASATAAPQAADAARNRLTGDGREGGFAITGAAWRRNESVTGTEGTFSSQRNQTIRGEQRSAMIGAAQLKERERPELPVSKVTGSSGNDAKGSAITYSGGARG
ncbi:MAG: transcriptional initiation protein Tat [Gallionellaceae bacterium]|nr:MAG: transcriptional initiation protein Tat [Gallionellaceae bacterium]